jgi:hypothetical protein
MSFCCRVYVECSTGFLVSALMASHRPSGLDFGRTATRKKPKSGLRPAEGRPEGRCRCFPGSSPAKLRPGRRIYGFLVSVLMASHCPSCLKVILSLFLFAPPLPGESRGGGSGRSISFGPVPVRVGGEGVIYVDVFSLVFGLKPQTL